MFWKKKIPYLVKEYDLISYKEYKGRVKKDDRMKLITDIRTKLHKLPREKLYDLYYTLKDYSRSRKMESQFWSSIALPVYIGIFTVMNLLGEDILKNGGDILFWVVGVVLLFTAVMLVVALLFRRHEKVWRYYRFILEIIEKEFIEQ
ncbi:hypothetical protein OTK01_000359 [Caldicellulosiruptor acetigenus]|uniref:hypothetical protein n=1 Tax=Caldicellulosiruptor acetigenus TaxID=301953 RepID=UPI0022A8E081|nr:hypothetical protein [Caldicellulosiruptor acetigenus]WAM36585.1 hypothetical protein OTK01_000359 [Caldicellulosiruptor acetigenus]